MACAFLLLLKRDVRLKGLEVRAREEREHLAEELMEERERTAQCDITALISTQHSFAGGLLRRLGTWICESGRRQLPGLDRRDVFLLENIARLVENAVSHEVLLDLVRNHLAAKSEEELRLYSDAKAEGYWELAKAELRGHSSQLDGADLAALMDGIPQKEFKALLWDVYSGARRIAGVSAK